MGKLVIISYKMSVLLFNDEKYILSFKRFLSYSNNLFSFSSDVVEPVSIKALIVFFPIVRMIIGSAFLRLLNENLSDLPFYFHNELLN